MTDRTIYCDRCGKALQPRKSLNILWLCLDCAQLVFPKAPADNGDIKVTKP